MDFFKESCLDFTNVCRACTTSKSSSMESLFTKYLAEMFTTCTALKVSKDDLLPHQLCSECTGLIKSFNDFRIKCHKSEKTLRLYVSSSKINEDKTIFPLSIKSDSGTNVSKGENPTGTVIENNDSNSNTFDDEEAPSLLLVENSQILNSNSIQQKTKTKKLRKFVTDTKRDIDKRHCRKQCPLCKKTFAYLRSLQKHEEMCRKSSLENGGSNKPTTASSELSCGLCFERHQNLEKLNQHLEEHKQGNAFSCKNCNFKGIDWADFLCHRFSHQSESNRVQIRCWACTKRFPNVERLEFHVRKVHLGKHPGLCKVCHKEFMNIKNWRAHKLIHTGIKPNKCKICGKCFTYKRSLVLHLRCHSDVKQYVCHTCGMAFKFHTGLTSHQFRIHSKVQSMICNHCGKTFKNRETLREHLLRVTSIKDIECPQCNKKYRSQRELDNHTKWHSQMKPFQCDQCGKSYKSNNHLNNHMRQHTGERPYRCDICTNSFMTSSVLKKHRMIHTGEKPHVCHVCRKAFIEKSNLKNHLRTHKQFMEVHLSKPIF